MGVKTEMQFIDKLRFGGLSHCGSVPLETERLILRRFRAADAAAMYENWADDPDVTRYLVWRAHWNVRETEEVIRYWESQYHRKDFYEWAIVPKSLGVPIGSIGVTKIKGMKTVMEFGYCIGKSWWGNGICAEASMAVLDLMFHRVGCTGMIAMHALPNVSSGRVMEKCGMTPKDCPPEPVRTENGKFYCRVYELSRERFEDVQADKQRATARVAPTA